MTFHLVIITKQGADTEKLFIATKSKYLYLFSTYLTFCTHPLSSVVQVFIECCEPWGNIFFELIIDHQLLTTEEQFHKQSKKNH